MPRRTVMMKRVTAETILSLLMRSSATIMPSGRENSKVRKKMAQVLPRPSLIFTIMVISDIGKPSFFYGIRKQELPESAVARAFG